MLFSTLLLGHEEGPTGAFAPKNPSKICPAQRRQRFKINGSFSTWKEVKIKGVPQGSLLGPLLLNIFLNNLLVLMNRTEICNYADDITIFVCDSEVEMSLRA